MHKKKAIVFAVFGVIFIVAACILGARVYKEESAIKDDMDLVEDIKKQVVEDDHGDLPSDISQNMAGEESFESSDPLLRSIDFGALMSINEQATRWIYIPDTGIDYYVMQELNVDNYFYLWRDIYKNQNSWGSILTPKVPDDVEDAHLLIFGHHMSNHSTVAFSALGAYKSQSYRNEHPYVYMYYPDRSERWSVWTACESTASDPIYSLPYTLGSEPYQELLDQVRGKKLYDAGNAPDNNSKTLVLSTCDSTSAGTTLRFYIVCTLDTTYKY